MGMGLEKRDDLPLPRGGHSGRAAKKPKGSDETLLVLTLLILLAWALYVGLSTVNWSAIFHAVGA